MAKLVCPSLVGREAELGRLEELLERARAGRGGLVVLSGEAGIGKTRLAGELAERARGIGMRTLLGRAVEATTPSPYRPLAEAFTAGLRGEDTVNDPSLDAYRPSLRRVVPDVGRGDASAEPGPPFAVMEGLRRLVELIAGDVGLLIVLEDLHWADADTLAVVEYLADHLGEAHVMCLCTERTETTATATALMTALVARRAAERVELSPLADAEVAEMARLTLGADEAPAVLVTALRARAAGVPFLVEEVLSAYLAAGGPAQRQPEWWISRRIADALPRSYRDIVRERLEAVDTGSRELIEAAAVLGRTFDWRLLAAMAAGGEREALEQLRAAARERLVSATAGHLPGFEFRHALAREAVLAELLPPERAALSARVADAIERAHPGLPGEWCERVADLREVAGQQLRAQAAMHEVARRAIARSAFGSAEQALLRARELGADDYMAWIGTEQLLLEVYARAGKTERVRELGEHLLDTMVARYPGWLHDAWLARLHLGVARGLAPSGEWDQVKRHLQQGGVLAQRAGDGALLAGVESLEAQAALAAGDPSRAFRHAASAKRAAERSGSTEALCEALEAEGRAAIASGDLESGVLAFESCAETAEDARLPLWRVRALLELGAIDDASRGELQRLHEARALAERIGAVSARAAADLGLAWGHLGRAELDAAEAALQRCLDAARGHRLAILAEALAARCMLHALRASAAELEEAADQAVRAAPTPTTEALVIGNGRAVLALARGDEAQALERVDEARRLAAPQAWSLSWLPGLAELLRVAAGTGVPDDPDHEPSPADPRVSAYRDYATAIAHGRAGRSADAARAFAAAGEAMQPGWRRAHAELIVARCAWVDGWGEPASWIRGALTFLDQALPRFASGNKAILRRAGAAVPRRGRGEATVPDQLRLLGVTSREMDVLLLVGERLSNTEIGDRLCLSPRTVEGHVGNLLQKLDLDARRELVEAGRRWQSGSVTEAGATPA